MTIENIVLLVFASLGTAIYFFFFIIIFRQVLFSSGIAPITRATTFFVLPFSLLLVGAAWAIFIFLLFAS